MVEFALVLPIFLVLLMGIIDFSVVFNEYNSVRSGVAESARQGVVANFDSADCSGSSSQRLVCLARSRIGVDNTRVKVLIPGGYSVGGSLRVCAMTDVDSLTGMFDVLLDDAVAKSSIDMRIEKLDDVEPLSDYEEASLPGQDWAWC